MRNKEPYIRAWQRKANTDFQAFYVLKESGASVTDAICFHAQQAVEKWLKCLLEFNNVEPPYTHDIGVLQGKLRTSIQKLLMICC